MFFHFCYFDRFGDFCISAFPKTEMLGFGAEMLRFGAECCDLVLKCSDLAL